MSTFTGNGKSNAKANQSDVAKDNPTPEEVKAADATTEKAAEVPADDANKPTSILNESEDEKQDRHIASTELPVKEITDPETQADTAPAEDAGELLVPGAAEGPDVGGTVLNDHGKVAYAPPGSYNAAVNGVQQDAAGHVDSVGTDNSSKSGTRI